MKKKNLILSLVVGALVGTMLTGCGQTDETVEMDNTTEVVEQVSDGEEVADESTEEPTEEVVEEPTEEPVVEEPEGAARYFEAGEFTYEGNYLAYDADKNQLWIPRNVIGTFEAFEPYVHPDGTMKTLNATITVSNGKIVEDGIEYSLQDTGIFVDINTGLRLKSVSANINKLVYNGTEIEIQTMNTGYIREDGTLVYEFEAIVPADYNDLAFAIAFDGGGCWTNDTDWQESIDTISERYMGFGVDCDYHSNEFAIFKMN